MFTDSIGGEISLSPSLFSTDLGSAGLAPEGQCFVTGSKITRHDSTWLWPCFCEHLNDGRKVSPVPTARVPPHTKGAHLAGVVQLEYFLELEHVGPFERHDVADLIETLLLRLYQSFQTFAFSRRRAVPRPMTHLCQRNASEKGRSLVSGSSGSNRTDSFRRVSAAR